MEENGKLIYPDHLTKHFVKVLKENGMRHIRLHDLRHSCASNMLADGVPMKEIQEWLGHSDFATTANVYSHLDYSAKVKAANTLLDAYDEPTMAIPKEDQEHVPDQMELILQLLGEMKKQGFTDLDEYLQHLHKQEKKGGAN